MAENEWTRIVLRVQGTLQLGEKKQKEIKKRKKRRRHENETNTTHKSRSVTKFTKARWRETQR